MSELRRWWIGIAVAMPVCVVDADAQRSGDLDPKDRRAVAALVVRSYDPYKKLTTITGPEIRTRFLKDYPNMAGLIYLLRHWTVEAKDVKQDRQGIWMDSTLVGSFQLYITFNTMDKKLGDFNDAWTIEGEKMEVSRIYMSSYVEVVGVNLTRKQMEHWASKEWFDAKLYGTKKDLTLMIPGTYFQGFLDAVKAAKNKVVRFQPLPR